jgi:hypothetical protein
MRIYNGEWTLYSILEQVSQPQTKDIDLKKLNEIVSRIPTHEIRKRRKKMDMFFEEVLVDADPNRGINFVNLLQILAQYNVLKNRDGLE